MNTSETIGHIAKALAEAQAMMKSAEFDSFNPHYKSRFASLAAMMDVARLPMAHNGLALTHGMMMPSDATRMTLVTTLMHVSGEYIRSYTPLILSKNDMQQLGAAITYAKRQAMSAMLGIVADEDDDGESVIQKPAPATSTAKQVAPITPKTTTVTTKPAPDAFAFDGPAFFKPQTKQGENNGKQ